MELAATVGVAVFSVAPLAPSGVSTVCATRTVGDLLWAWQMDLATILGVVGFHLASVASL